MAFPKIIATPERDSWLYNGRISRVCSGFVFEVLRAGGVLPNITFQVKKQFHFILHAKAAEQTPSDLTLLDIYDKHNTRPQACVSAGFSRISSTRLFQKILNCHIVS